MAGFSIGSQHARHAPIEADAWNDPLFRVSLCGASNSNPDAFVSPFAPRTWSRGRAGPGCRTSAAIARDDRPAWLRRLLEDASTKGRVSGVGSRIRKSLY